MMIVLLAGLTSCQGPPPPEVVAPPPGLKLQPHLARLVAEHVAAAKKAPDEARSHGELGMVYEANALWDLAERSYRNAATLDAAEPGWPYHRALSQLALGQSESAEELLREVTGRFPGFAPAWHELGTLLLRRGLTDEAESCYREAHRLVPADPVPRVGIADCMLRRKQYGEARVLLEEALDLAPRYGQAHFLLGSALRELGEEELALVHMKRGTDSSRERLRDAIGRELVGYEVSLASLMDQAIQLVQLNRVGEAVRLLEQLRASHPGEVSVLNNLGSAYLQMGRGRDALAVLDEALALEPTNFRTYINRARVLQAVNRPEEALLSAEAATEYGAKAPEAHFLLADLLMAAGRLEEARPALESTVALDPDHLLAHQALSEVHMRAGRFAAAVPEIEECIRLRPGELRFRGNLALMLCRIGEEDRARRELETIRARQADHPMLPAIERALAQLAEQP